MATTVDRLHTKVTADTKQAKRSMRDYGAAGERAGASITAGFAQFGLAMAGVQAAIAGVAAVFRTADFANEIGRMRTVVGDTFGRELAAATGGTISNLEALKFGALSLTGAFKLTGEEMKTLAAFADDLGKKTLKGTSVHLKEFSDALNTGRVNSLKPYGIEIDESIRDPTEKAQAVLKAVHELSKSPLANDEAASNFDKYKAQMENQTNAIKEFIGGITGSMVRFFGNAIEESKGFVEEIRKLTLAGRLQEKIEQDARDRTKSRAITLASGETFEKFGKEEQGSEEARSFFRKRRLEILGRLRGDLDSETVALAESIKAAMSAGKGAVGDQILADRDAKIAAAKRAKAKKGGGFVDDKDDKFTGSEGTLGEFFTLQGKLDDLAAESERVEKLKDLDRQRADSAKRAAQAIVDAKKAEIEAFNASVGAWAGGSQSMISIMESLFGKSKELTVLSAIIKVAEEGAKAASAFASLNIPQGLLHTAAAVQWGVVAAKAGGSGGSSNAGSGAARGAAGGGFSRPGGGGAGSQTININVNAGIGTQPDEIAVAINAGIRGAERRGSIQPRENSIVRHS